MACLEDSRNIFYMYFFFLGLESVAVAYLFPNKTLAWHHLGWMSVLIKNGLVLLFEV
jgi:hypothetical protein